MKNKKGKNRKGVKRVVFTNLKLQLILQAQINQFEINKYKLVGLYIFVTLNLKYIRQRCK